MQILLNEFDKSIRFYLESNTVLPGTYINAGHNIPEDYRIEQLNRIADKFVTQPIKNAPTGYTTNTKIISTYEDVIEHFKDSDDKYFVTGYTDTKFSMITKFFKKNDVFNYVNATNGVQVFKYVGDENNKPTLINEDLTDNELTRVGLKFTIPGLDISAMILVDSPTNPEYVLYLDTENPIKYIDFGNEFTIFKYMRSNIEEPETANIILYDGFVEEPKIISEVFIDRGLNSGFENMKKLKNVTDLNELTKTGLGYYRINRKGYNFKNI